MEIIQTFFNVISNIISFAIIIIFFVIFIKIVKAISNASKNNGHTVKHSNVNRNVKRDIPIMRYQKPTNQEPTQEENLYAEYRKSKVKGKSISSEMSSLENRGNDWLAKQLKEEQDVLRRSDFLDLGAMHDRACAADKLRMSHRDNCEDKYVDDGIR